MAQSIDPSSRREAVQPSLWDRLVDDLPGLVAETDALKADLENKLGTERVERLVSGGLRAVEREPDIDEETRKRLVHLSARQVERQRLENRGIVVTPEVLREAVRRDIEALFNIERLEVRPLLSDREQGELEAPADLLADFPEVRRSVLNYGVPSFAGHTGSDFDRDALARDIKEVLAVYEPRLKRETIRVQVRISPKTGMRVDIDGMLMLSPVPERLHLSTTIDLDNGRAVTAAGGR